MAEAIFNTRRFVIDEVPGLNGGLHDPVRRPLENSTCSVCHDTPNAGNHSVAMALNIGVADASRRQPDLLPLYTLRRCATPGAPADHRSRTRDGDRQVGRHRQVQGAGPACARRAAVSFHDGSAATLMEVIDFYDSRFQARFHAARKGRNLLAFLRAL